MTSTLIISDSSMALSKIICLSSGTNRRKMVRGVIGLSSTESEDNERESMASVI
jgi:hypothetical protein